MADCSVVHWAALMAASRVVPMAVSMVDCLVASMAVLWDFLLAGHLADH